MGVKEFKIPFAQCHGSKVMGAENYSQQYIESRISGKTDYGMTGSVV
jgi:hypothetical protein